MTTPPNDHRPEVEAPAAEPDGAAGDLRAAPARRAPAWGAARVALTIVLAGAGFAWLIRVLVDRDPVRGAWTWQVMLSIAAILAAFWDVAHRRRFWTLPMQRLTHLTRQARDGEAPIDALTSVRGGVEPLIPLVQSLLRELRHQQTVIAELNVEMHQKVANRTDALERVIGSLRQQATRDALTGLFNRRFLDSFLPQAVARARATRSDLCLLMIDVDHFKTLNDTLGHAAGDELLKAIGQLVRSTIRGEDVGFRCGGDEFVILLPGHDAKSGRALGDRLTSLVDALAKTIRVPTLPRLSVGVATLGMLPDAASPEQLLAEADRSLYTIKAQRHTDDPAYTSTARAKRNRPAA
jgi:diguanylate cyclase (GGDEF)-like protein